MNIKIILFANLIFITLNIISLISIDEREYKAAKKSFFLSICISLPFFILGIYNFTFAETIVNSFIIGASILFFILMFPYPVRNPKEYQIPKSRIDERDTMFARARLVKGEQNYNEYYERNPDKKDIDDRIRNNPGTLSKNSKYYDSQWFTAADTNFNQVRELRSKVDGPVNKDRISLSKTQNTSFIKNWLNELGISGCGITKLKDYHLYSYGGRDNRYGKIFKQSHKYAIAFTVPMDFRLVKSAPQAPIIFESSRCYLESGQMAIILAKYIRQMGFPARAHIDGNYKVVCPLVAKDAGLGEIGRMGILMTPTHGPRVRIAVVTTDLPLKVDTATNSPSLIDFCDSCKKCARVCPSNAIPYDDRKNINDCQRWQINQESCYKYWTEIGTDCGRCIQVCPYSHPDNIFHNIIRKGIQYSPLFRKMAILLDDFFYGKTPDPDHVPDWFKSI